MAENNADTRTTLFVELLLPVPVPKLFTYRVPLLLNDRVIIGQRAIVQFGDRKILTGIISEIHDRPPLDYEAKYLLEVLDDYPVVTDSQLQLFRWMADYYVCTMGEILNAAMPSGLKLSSESRVQLHPSFNLDESTQPFSEKELMLLKRLQHESLEYSQIAALLEVKHLYTILKSLVAKDAIILYEEVREKYKPKTEKRIRLTNTSNSSTALELLFESLAAKPKQEAILLKYLQEVPVLSDPVKNNEGLSKATLISEGLSESSLNTLIKREVLEEFDVVMSRFGQDAPESLSTILLSDEQNQAHNDILASFKEKDTLLFHGITGSGKTEIYIQLIKRALEGGSQVLYLLPEIALTTQVVQRLKKVFGSEMGIYHSRFSDNERVEVWNGILQGKFKFVVGVRSAIFLPFDNLGLIIVDEEHDASYKQQEPAPRYHARDVALVLSQQHHAKVILGSATPSLESYYLAQQKKYGYVRLDKRFGEAQLPAVILADLSEARKRKTMKGEFSQVLLSNIDETLKKEEQVIIFQNRRGYSPMVNCEVCGWVPKCINCAVSLTYHQFRNAMVCHYCGYKESLPEKCPTCSSVRLKTVGYGTEKLEEELTLYFPDSVVQRMDMDTTRSKSGYENILEQFETGKTNILVGTQMVTKGLDFDRVSMVGIFNADRMIHFPDFRSYERAFQLITQVSGRAGRRDKPGLVVIQTANPQHPLLQTVLHQDAEAFYENQLSDRRAHHYPPYSRLIEMTVKHTDKKVAKAAAQELFSEIADHLPGLQILGPGEPMIPKIRNQYLMNILIKIPRGSAALSDTKATLSLHAQKITKNKVYRNLRVIIDVDPI
ncbi:MAG: primosomal protein N' [Chryseolinea sp.]